MCFIMRLNHDVVASFDGALLSPWRCPLFIRTKVALQNLHSQG